jgi:transcriptional regulator of NAD metabolism
VYGELTASVMIQTRKEVETFIKKIQETNATYLSQLTDGIHLHTIEADTIEKLNAACLALEAEGYLVSNE